MTEQLGYQNNGGESFMEHCKEEAINFSLKIAELVEIDPTDIEQEEQ